MTGPWGGAMAVCLLALSAFYLHGAFSGGFDTLTGDDHISAGLCAGIGLVMLEVFVVLVVVLARKGRK